MTKDQHLKNRQSQHPEIDEFVDKHGPTYIQNWINTYHNFFEISSKAADKPSVRGMRPLTDFFTT